MKKVTFIINYHIKRQTDKNQTLIEGFYEITETEPIDHLSIVKRERQALQNRMLSNKIISVTITKKV